MPQKHPDRTARNHTPQVVEELELVLRKIRETLAVTRSPGQKFALVRLVEELGLEEWHAVAARLDLHGWLALPLDEEDGVPLERFCRTLEELARQRDYDFLTGLANRRMFDRVAQGELHRALRTETPLSLVMMDIDNFKDVNDTHGHATGDKVLAALGDILKSSLRGYDLAARLGGEEFCLMLPGASALQARDLTERILGQFRAARFEGPGGETFSCTFSAGVAAGRNRPGHDTVADLLRQADDLLYQAKSQGKDQVCVQGVRYAVSQNPALVQVAEKQFLFTGIIAQ